jgi:hypothetical protein
MELNDVRHLKSASLTEAGGASYRRPKLAKFALSALLRQGFSILMLASQFLQLCC